MRIGVSIMTGRGQNLWNNGLVQNIYHFACLMDAIPFVEKVYLLNCGDVSDYPPGTDEAGRRFPLIKPAEAEEVIDVAVELGGALDPEWVRRMRARGKKVVLHICGQPYIALIEPTVFDREGFFGDPDRCDEVWLLAKDMIFASMLESIHRRPVFEVPYLWAPRFLDNTIQYDDEGRPLFGYRPGSLAAGSVQPSIFEPNLSPIKMGLVPILICDLIERDTPNVIKTVNYMNCNRMTSHAAFVALIQNLSLYQNRKIVMAARDYFAHVMGRGGNIVVSHQINCIQNYLYLDALHGGYPLVHNSSHFRDLGYYYEGSDIAAGAAAMRRAIETHDQNLDNYRKDSERAIERLSPLNRANIEGYSRRLVSLMHPGSGRKAA